MRRPVHYLRANHSCRTPKRAIFFDCESLPHEIDASRESHQLRLWTACFCKYHDGCIINEKWFSGHSASEFWQFAKACSSPRETLWLFAHNLCFDFTLVEGWEQLTLRGNSLKRCVIEDPPVILGFEIDECSYKAVDTLNYWPSSLASLGESVGLPQHEMPDYSDPENTWLAYCANDTNIIKGAVSGLIRMIHERNLGNFAPTASGIAWSAYRHRFMHSAILIHADEDAVKLERAACHGGLNVVWKIGRVDNPVLVLDVNSLYPSVMNEHAYPCKLLDYGHGESVDSVQRMLNDGLGVIASVRLDCRDDFPLRRHCGSVMACGRFSTTLAGPELLRAIQSGSTKSIGSFAVYRLAHIFSFYVEYFYLLRMECKRAGNRAGSELCKTLLNSLWGKFQQRSHSWIDRKGEIPEGAFSQWSAQKGGSEEVRTYRSVAWLVQELVERGESDNSFPAIGAYVLAYGRERMRQLRLIAGLKDCYYCDTDSLHVSAMGQHRLWKAGELSETTLGKMKLQGSWPHAEYFGVKDYTLGSKVTLAGRKANAVDGERGVYSQDEFQGVKSVVQSQPLPEIIVSHKTIRRSVKAVDGIVDVDGWVSPPILSE